MTSLPQIEALNLDEEQRVAALHEYCLLDQPADDELSAVIRVAAMVADVGNATLNLIDENRQCQLTTHGFAGCDSSRSDSMCAVHFRTGRAVHLFDARESPEYRDNPWVDGRMGNVRSYTSAPLITPEGYALGTLCVFDTVPKALSPEQINRIRDLADVLVALFERRRQAREYELLAQETARRRKFTETVLDTVEVAIAAADPEGHLTVFNRAAREWHGLPADPMLAPSAHSDRYNLFDADGVARLREDEIPLMRALHGDEVTGAEMAIRPPGDHLINVSANARRMLDDEGNLMGAVVAMNNVTSDRMYRRELERAHSALADAVVELQRSNEELEQFAGAVSHDLVRPMAAAHGYLELLTEEHSSSLGQQGSQWLASAMRAVERMQRLVDALLTYARAGQAAINPQPVPLSEVVAAVLTDLRPALEAAGGEVVVPDDLPTVTGDETLIRQLLQNLIDNALKYSHPDRPSRVTVGALRAGPCWEITVADNGIGIPPDQRDRVFEMFAQVDPEARKGHGIGLSTCQRIVTRHAGTILVEDTPGGGTTIRLTLPS
jgi:signal transduction histidine kinase